MIQDGCESFVVSNQGKCFQVLSVIISYHTILSHIIFEHILYHLI